MRARFSTASRFSSPLAQRLWNPKKQEKPLRLRDFSEHPFLLSHCVPPPPGQPLSHLWSSWKTEVGNKSSHNKGLSTTKFCRCASAGGCSTKVFRGVHSLKIQENGILLAPYCAIPWDYLSETPLLRAMGFLVSQHGQLGAIPPPPSLSDSPLESMRSRGAIPPPPQKGYLSDTGAISHENKANGCDTPSAILSRKGIVRYGGGISHWATKNGIRAGGGSR